MYSLIRDAVEKVRDAVGLSKPYTLAEWAKRMDDLKICPKKVDKAS